MNLLLIINNPFIGDIKMNTNPFKGLHSDVYNAVELYFSEGVLHIGFTDNDEWKHFCKETDKPICGWRENDCMFSFEDEPKLGSPNF
tara:strand:- start:86 stop:346 length:261 start_codon:yes stop_codon:yes gene_type:complete